jgi:acetyltransferase-like isoleucine patch superfamily enzyme
MRELATRREESRVVSFLIMTYHFFEDFNLFAATITGYIPIHTIRILLYKHLFRVDVPLDAIVYWRCRFFEPAGVHIGHHSIIGNDAFLDGRNGLFVGSNVNIAAEVRIYTLEHDITSADFRPEGSPVHIDDWAYVGPRVTILPGVRIGEGAVVAAGAVVAKDVEPWTMVGGVPAKFIKRRPIVQYTLDRWRKTLFQ